MRRVFSDKIIACSCFIAETFFAYSQSLEPLFDQIQQEYSNRQIFPIWYGQTT